MLRKTTSGIMLTLLFIGMLTLTFNIQPVKSTWTGTVYIRADGSIDPPDAPIITYDNITYTLTDNITSSANGIVVERDNIVIDGAGYTLQGSGTWSKGIYLLGRNNVTIKNTNIKDFRYGVQFNSTFHSILSANNITRNVEGVRLDFSSGNALSGNSIERNEHFGVYLWESSHNTISGNYIADTYGYTDSKGLVLKKSSNNVVDGNIVIGNDYGGIVLLGSSNNIISANNVTDNGYWTDDYGIELTYCSIWQGCWPTSYSDNNTIIGNNVTRNTSGIGLCASWYNNITANTVINNSGNGVHMETSSYNTLRDNNIAGNKYNFGVFTLLDSGVFSLSTYIQDIDTTNMVNGKPVYYLVNQKGLIIDSSDIGYLALVNCTDITVRNLSLTNNGQGLLLSFTTNSTVENVTIAHNRVGIHILNSDVNTITASNVTKNVCGINIYRASFNNITRTSLTQNSGWGGILIGRLVAGLALCATSKTVTSEYNIISNNTISDNRGYLGSIVLSNPGTKHTIIANNNITNNGYDGILLERYSNTNTIAGNDVSNNAYGIMLDRSSNNTLRSNSMANNHYNFGVQGGSISDFVNDVDVSNTVDGKPIYYWINRMDRAIPADAGYVALVNSYNITAKGLKLKNNGQGILLINTTNSQIINNNITNNYNGIRLVSSSNNTIYHNNLFDNTVQIYVEYSGYPNVWDNGYPSGGNYWSDYAGVDADGDGIGDTAYVIDENNRDRYPLMNPWGSGTPVASFSWSPSTPEVGELVTFDASASLPVGGEIVSYEWDFGDGNHATGEIVTHAYGSAGTYTVTLNVTDSEGLWDVEQKQIEVKAPPPPLTVSISPTSASILIGQSVTFTSAVSGGYTPYSYQWFLNGNPVSGATADTWTFTPTESGIFYVYVKVTDDKGDTAQSETARITVSAVPVGGYSIPINVPTTTTKPVTPYIALLAILTTTLITIKRKTKRKH